MILYILWLFCKDIKARSSILKQHIITVDVYCNMCDQRLKIAGLIPVMAGKAKSQEVAHQKTNFEAQDSFSTK